MSKITGVLVQIVILLGELIHFMFISVITLILFFLEPFVSYLKHLLNPTIKKKKVNIFWWYKSFVKEVWRGFNYNNE